MTFGWLGRKIYSDEKMVRDFYITSTQIKLYERSEYFIVPVLEVLCQLANASPFPWLEVRTVSFDIKGNRAPHCGGVISLC